MADGPLGCRRRSQPRYHHLSNQASPPPSPSGSISSSRSSICSSTSPRRSPSSSSRIANHHCSSPTTSSSSSPLPLRHQIYNIFSTRTLRRLTFILYNNMYYGMASSQRLEGISRLCAVYSFTGILFTAYVGTMIKIQPIYIKGINVSNQEITKESAFGAMGMFIFLFTLSVVYLCYRKYRRDYDDHDEHAIRARGYMRPLNLQLRSNNNGVELPNAVGISALHSDSEEEEEEEENDGVNHHDVDDDEFDTVVN